QLSTNHRYRHSFPTRRSSDLGQEVRDIIERTAKKVNDTLYNYVPTTGRLNGDWNDEMGYGLVNAYDAVMEAGILDLYMRNSNDEDRKSTRLNSSHVKISYAVF